jgi:hypothetical protein
MPIDVANDDLVGLEVVAKRFRGANGKPKTLKTVIGWVQIGVKGSHSGDSVRLEAKRVGGTWYTTEDAIRQFADATTNQSMPQPVKKRPAKKTASYSRAMSKLKARGMCK